jgi:hypothetical protein
MKYGSAKGRKVNPIKEASEDEQFYYNPKLFQEMGREPLVWSFKGVCLLYTTCFGIDE